MPSELATRPIDPVEIDIDQFAPDIVGDVFTWCVRPCDSRVRYQNIDRTEFLICGHRSRGDIFRSRNIEPSGIHLVTFLTEVSSATRKQVVADIGYDHTGTSLSQGLCRSEPYSAATSCDKGRLASYLELFEVHNVFEPQFHNS